MMLNKNFLKRLLLMCLAASIAMPAYADWRSSFAQAVQWVSKKSASAITRVGTLFTKQGACIPNASAVVTDISDPIPMDYVVPMVPVSSESVQLTSSLLPESKPYAIFEEIPKIGQPQHSWYSSILDKCSQIGAYTKYIIGAAIVGGVGLYAWNKYCDYKRAQKIAQPKTLKTNYHTYKKFLNIFKEEKKKLEIELDNQEKSLLQEINAMAEQQRSDNINFQHVDTRCEQLIHNCDQLMHQKEQTKTRIAHITEYENKFKELDEKSMSSNQLDEKEIAIAQLALAIIAENEL